MSNAVLSQSGRDHRRPLRAQRRSLRPSSPWFVTIFCWSQPRIRPPAGVVPLPIAIQVTAPVLVFLTHIGCRRIRVERRPSPRRGMRGAPCSRFWPCTRTVCQLLRFAGGAWRYQSGHRTLDHARLIAG